MKAPNMPWMIPYLTVVDVKKSVNFYRDAFGFDYINGSEDEAGDAVHAELKYQDLVVMIGKQGKYDGDIVTPNTSNVNSPVTLYVYVEDVDAAYKRAVEHGAIGITEPEDAFWGDRYCMLKDIDGLSWCFGAYKGEAK